ncbi:protein toll-like [Diorhabda carinulata]|uniref:protein toll-like n=1 Tax=Diorhabda carinulata TaxID=1163345 RepID=UPI0025A2D76C|nr:protein toll-like [Diorhabda carinulata]
MKFYGIFGVLYHVTFVTTMFNECNNNKNPRCLCIHSHDEYEYQCQNVLIHGVPYKYFHLDCESDKNLELPNYKSGNTTLVRIRLCPLPDRLSSLLKKFDIRSVKKLILFNTPIRGNTSFDKNTFNGYSEIEELTLDSIENQIDNDVLDNFQKLIQFNLGNSEISKLTNFNFPANLKILHITESRITKIPKLTVSKELKELHLWGNDIHKLETEDFKNLKYLESLDLSSNSISSIDEDSFADLKMLRDVNFNFNNLRQLNKTIFNNNKKLDTILLSYNPYLELHNELFVNLSQLKTINLKYCRISNLPEQLFKDTKNIREILLGNNEIKIIPPSFLAGLTKLEILDLSENSISALPDQIFIDLVELQTLKLNDNNLSTITESLFGNTANLVTLSLKNNRIKSIHIEAFENLQNLKSIDLSNNLYRHEYYYEASPFVGCEALENIVLKNNQIETFPSLFITMQSVKQIDLSSNKIESIQLAEIASTVFSEIEIIDLKNNKIEEVDFIGVETILKESLEERFDLITERMNKVILDLRENSLPCDCQNFDLVKYFHNQLDPLIENSIEILVGDTLCRNNSKRIVDVYPQDVNCIIIGINCPLECDCFWRPYTKFVEVDCAMRNLTYFPKININTTKLEVNLNGNKIVDSPSPELGYDNVQNLILSNNNLENIQWIPRGIEILKVNGNNLYNLDVGIFNGTTKLTSMNLADNPWECECSATDLQNFLKSHYKLVNSNEVLCFNDGTPLVEKNDLCRYSFAFKLSVLLTVGFLVFLVISLGCYISYRMEIKIWLYSRNCCLWFVAEDELDEDKKYDIFVSFARQDERLVTDYLLPALESGPEPFSTCVHFRDWIPGSTIMSNIRYSILNSKRTLVVLSNNFLDSVWSKKEFYLAHTHAINEGRARLIVIKYGDIDESKLDGDLKAYLDTNTYLEWGKPWFWNKLVYALPHSRKKKLFPPNV